MRQHINLGKSLGLFFFLLCTTFNVIIEDKPMSVSIPTLSMAGWINSTAEKASYMIGCFIAANYSQSVARYGNIETLQYLIKKHAGKMEDLESALQGAFERVVNATFPNTGTAIVTVEQTDEDDPSIFTISLV